MADSLTLEATRRDVLGKKVRFLRREGITPIHVFGSSIESQTLQTGTFDLQKVLAQAGTTRPISLEVDGRKQGATVFVREIQRDSIKRTLIHVDFYQVKKGERIKVEVPVVFVGEAPAMKEKGRILTRGLDKLVIESLPEAIPSLIEVDLSPLVDLQKMVFVKDIPMAKGIEVITDGDQLVVKVSELAVERVIEAAPTAVAEGEAKAEEAPAEGAAAEEGGEKKAAEE